MSGYSACMLCQLLRFEKLFKQKDILRFFCNKLKSHVVVFGCICDVGQGAAFEMITINRCSSKQQPLLFEPI